MVEAEPEPEPDSVPELSLEPEPTSEPETVIEPDTPAAPTVDYSKEDPTKWDCFGYIEPDNSECKGCCGREACAVKAGVTL